MNHCGLFRFALEKQTYGTGSPASFIGRNICCLKCREKNNYLIKKLSESIRLPSAEEIEELNQKFRIFVAGSNCFLSEISGGRMHKLRSLGTENIPAFYHNKSVFVLDQNKKIFIPVELKVACFNNNYVVMWISDTLLIRFDRHGLYPLGSVETLYITPASYILVAKRGKHKSVYVLAEEIQPLFELTNRSTTFKVDVEKGLIIHEYFIKDSSFERFLEEYKQMPNGSYVQTNRVFCPTVSW